ncbi:MAG: hypothetical protein Q4P30_02700 [Eubacteriales bacterium]|nr:hypothetical protein [Eubacteriales bacterium]
MKKNYLKQLGVILCSASLLLAGTVVTKAAPMSEDEHADAWEAAANEANKETAPEKTDDQTGEEKYQDDAEAAWDAIANQNGKTDDQIGEEKYQNDAETAWNAITEMNGKTDDQIGEEKYQNDAEAEWEKIINANKETESPTPETPMTTDKPIIAGEDDPKEPALEDEKAETTNNPQVKKAGLPATGFGAGLYMTGILTAMAGFAALRKSK